MKASEVIDVLCGHWPAGESLCIPEAPQDVMRMGRKIDLLVCSFWRSRGYALDAVEVKVSHSDWMREVNNPEKADFWYEHSDRFWVAVPSELTARVRDTLPPTWGLLGISGGRASEVVKAPKHDRTPLTWGTTLGIIRASSGAGANAVQRAYERGRQEGHRSAEASARGSTQYEALRSRVESFEKASGLDLANWRADFRGQDPEQLGDAVKRLLEVEHEVERAERRLRDITDSLAAAHRRAAALLAIREGEKDAGRTEG